MLNPYTPVADPVNRRIGNPDLDTQYTDAVTFDVSWSGQAETLRFSPYLLRTRDGWESVTEVDEAGFSTITWANFASTRSYGSSMTVASQANRPLSGSLTFNTYYVRQDASNISPDFSGEDLRWSANVSASARLASTLSLQGRLNVYSERDVGQVRAQSDCRGQSDPLSRLWWIKRFPPAGPTPQSTRASLSAVSQPIFQRL